MTACAGLMLSCSNGSEEQVEQYMDFLYRYMPLPDSTDYSHEFYEQNVRLALQARAEMPWGRSVPEREFRHFVVPLRVNNETLDSARAVFYPELKQRVEHLSMQDAILEVNHWCHEHVTYRPSDARTSSPLASIRTAYGRCGEESTLLVAALRSVAIPARQVYTPRWAHTDDNHAWVEAWADGRWWFLGACEPEPVLNLGWFNESASRGMLMHTRVFGDYDGPEDVMSRTACYTEINVIDNYAPTSKVTVVVQDTLGRPVSDAVVEFKLYNYAEFYTVATKTTDTEGRATLTAGRGDMLVWVSKDGMTAIEKASPDRESAVYTVNVRLTPASEGLRDATSFDIVPPPVSAALPEVTAEQRAENDRRLAREDSIRKSYEQTMPNEDWRGNHAVIQQFLDEAQDKALAQRLLDVLAKKDLRDVTLDVLRDNLLSKEFSDLNLNSSLTDKYVLCPRVEFEHLTPYKHFFRQVLKDIKSVEQLVQWTRDSITIVADRNPQHLRMQPMSVYRYRRTDELGRDIFFVSAARALGFPARINEVDQKPQYYKDGQWVDIHSSLFTPHSSLKLNYLPVAHYDDPKYYIHFTLSRIENGTAQLMTFPEEATWKNTFAGGVELEPGDYILVTGTRLASGKVLAHLTPFNLPPTPPNCKGGATVDFTMREDPEEPQVIGSLNAESLYTPLGTDRSPLPSTLSLLATTGRGFYILGIVAPNQEPTNHALRDICACSGELEKWGRKIMLLFENADDVSRFNFDEFEGLPSTVTWGIDHDGAILREARREMKLTTAALPVFMVCDTFNRVVFVSQGYTINLGEQLLKVVRQL